MKNSYRGHRVFHHAVHGGTIDLVDVYDCGNKHIMMIKLMRGFTGWGLKEAKEWTDQYKMAATPVGTPGNSGPRINIPRIVEALYEMSVEKTPDSLSKEQILDIFSEALDAGEILHFSDPIDIIIATAENIQKNGGVAAIAAKLDEFINAL